MTMRKLTVYVVFRLPPLPSLGILELTWIYVDARFDLNA